MSTNFATIKNQETLPLRDLPVLPYQEFFATANELLHKQGHHCVNYYAAPYGIKLKFICCIADDYNHDINVLSYELDSNTPHQVDSLSKDHYRMHIYEREISENFGIEFTGHPWPKPVRYAWNRADQEKVINNYPFYRIDGGELHEVGVGPIHAGVIEPGHFRFLCKDRKSVV